MEIVQCSSPGHVGRIGIIIQERKNQLLLIDEAKKLLSVSKSNLVFKIKVNDIPFLIFGNQLISEPYLRISKKFKIRGSIELK